MMIRILADTPDGRGVVTVRVSDNCPICQQPRGQPYSLTVRDGDRMFTVDKWDNECGHKESDTNLLREAWQS